MTTSRNILRPGQNRGRIAKAYLAHQSMFNPQSHHLRRPVTRNHTIPKLPSEYFPSLLLGAHLPSAIKNVSLAPVPYSPVIGMLTLAIIQVNATLTSMLESWHDCAVREDYGQDLIYQLEDTLWWAAQVTAVLRVELHNIRDALPWDWGAFCIVHAQFYVEWMENGVIGRNDLVIVRTMERAAKYLGFGLDAERKDEAFEWLLDVFEQDEVSRLGVVEVQADGDVVMSGVEEEEHVECDATCSSTPNEKQLSFSSGTGSLTWFVDFSPAAAVSAWSILCGPQTAPTLSRFVLQPTEAFDGLWGSGAPGNSMSVSSTPASTISSGKGMAEVLPTGFQSHSAALRPDPPVPKQYTPRAPAQPGVVPKPSFRFSGLRI